MKEGAKEEGYSSRKREEICVFIYNNGRAHKKGKKRRKVDGKAVEWPEARRQKTISIENAGGDVK